MKIAVRMPNWLGDAVMALPALEDLVATFPDARIHVFATPPARGVLDHAELPVELHTLERPMGRVRMFRRALRVLRRERYELGVIFPPSLSSALLFQLGGVRARVGYRGHGRARLLTHAMEDVPRGDVHLSHELRALAAEAARALGRRPGVGSGHARVTPTSEGRARIRALIDEDGPPVAVLAPGAVYGPTKRWPAASFAALADRLAEEHGARIVLTGAAQDVPVCREVHASATCDPLDLSGRTGLETLVALLAGAALVVSNDSGAMHLAAAAGAPVVAIFGSTNPRWTSPLSERSHVIWRRESCAPCYRRRCPIGEVCLRRIDVDQVAAACRELLGGRLVG